MQELNSAGTNPTKLVDVPVENTRQTVPAEVLAKYAVADAAIQMEQRAKPVDPVKPKQVSYHIRLNKACTNCKRIKQVRGTVTGPENAVLKWECDFCGNANPVFDSVEDAEKTIERAQRVQLTKGK